jgi:hypothetical protein
MVPVLKAGDRSPSVVGTSHDGRAFDLEAPGRRTVLWFSPKAGLVDELMDRLIPPWSP